jgi:hypothetical protein
MHRLAGADLSAERVYSVVFRTNASGARFEVMNIIGERKLPEEIARDLLAAADRVGYGLGLGQVAPLFACDNMADCGLRDAKESG